MSSVDPCIVATKAHNYLMEIFR